MKFDFFKDLEQEIQLILHDYGALIPTTLELRRQDKNCPQNPSPMYDLKNLLLHLCSLYLRRVPVQPWNVHVSKELRNETRISDIKEKLEKGEDVNDLISNAAMTKDQSQYSDKLLAEWGIYHLHFSSNRSGDLLFVKFDRDSSNAFFIDILPHERNGQNTWANINLIQIIHDNWPEIVAPAQFISSRDKIENPEDVPEHLTTKMHKTLRKKNASVIVTTYDDAQYLPMGGGLVASGHSVKAIWMRDFVFMRVQELTNVVNEHKEKILEVLGKTCSDIELHLHLDDSLKCYIVDTKSSTKIVC